MGAVRRIALAAAAFAVTMCGPVNADDYPSRPVKIIVPFGAGGPTDVYTRAIGEELRKSLHQPFVMDNRPGAGTTIGTDFVAKSPPDGYTLLMVSGTQTVNETLYAHKQYQLMRDLVPVAPLIDTDLVLSFIRRCRRRPWGSCWRSRGQSQAPSTTVRPARARTTTWPASCLKT